jgi:hypothetical protein
MKDEGGGEFRRLKTKCISQSTARMLGVDAAVSMTQSTRGTIVDLSAIEFRRLKSYDAWVIKLEHLNSENVSIFLASRISVEYLLQF